MKDKPVILVVDDQPQNIELLEVYLIPQGYEIVTATTGGEALRKLSDNQIDLILLDVVMPDMDGFEVIRRIRQDNTHRLLPIILVTMLREPEARLKGIEAGCDDFISTPVDRMELIARIKSLLKVKAYHDLTSNYRKELESEVNRRTEELKHAFIFQQCLIDALSVPVFYKDLEGRYLGCNSSFEKFFGQKRELFVGKSFSELSLKEFSDISAEKDRALLQNRGIQIYESSITDSGGVVHNVILHKATFDNLDGSVGGLIGAILDITDLKIAEELQKNLESQLHQAQKMESIGRLAGGVAHDYNNALSVIIGFTQLAREKMVSTDPLRSDLDEVLKAARHATDITRQLLAFARKQTIAPKVLDLNENVESMLKMLRRLIGEDISLAWLPGAGVLSVKIDSSQIDQILANLCVNARDAIVGVGKITIETKMVTFDTAYCADHHGFIPGEFVMLAVSDNGCGIDQEILGNIFEPFFTTKSPDKGTGLGLSTVYGIVKQNNGFIDIYSKLDTGTTIKIYLPRYEGNAVGAQRESKEEIPQGCGETILIVEDDLSILNLARRILNELNYTVLTADKPERAVRLAEEHQGEIDLLVTDVIMPEMNGLELANSLRSLYPALKCVFMSGYTSDVIAHHGVLDQGVHFLQKPFSKKDLIKNIRKILDDVESVETNGSIAP
jgi:PAS domain S-box-containing protein